MRTDARFRLVPFRWPATTGTQEPDGVLIRRAGRRAAAQAALLVALSFVLCAGLVLLVVVHGQDRDTDAQLRAAAGRADDVTDPPDGITLLLRKPDGTVQATPGVVTAFADRADLTAALSWGTPALTIRDVHVPGSELRVLTERRFEPGGVTVVQAVMSLRPQHAERARLLAALAAAGAVALLFAAVLGAVNGRRTVRGLVVTLARQRGFVADASHELRTPLTVLATRAQLLRRRLDSPGLAGPDRLALARDTDRLIADSARLAEVVDDLLAASEPAPAGGQPSDLAAIAADAAESVRPLAQDKSVTLVRDGAAAAVVEGAALSTPAGQVPQRLLVLASSAALRRSLVALLDNAVRHTPAGGVVTVSLDAAEQTATVTVGDSGPGIPPEVQDRLFDRFSSGERRGERAGPPGQRRRYGLGLALVADTVHRAGGSVTVHSGPVGTRFVIELPRVRSDSADIARRERLRLR